MTFHNAEKTETRQWKCTTSLTRPQNHNGEIVDRSWLCFSPSQACVPRLRLVADVTNRYEDATITFSRRCN